MVGMSNSSCNYQDEHDKDIALLVLSMTYQKLNVLDRHLFRDPYSPVPSFHRANSFRLSLRLRVSCSICEDARLAVVYHDWTRNLGVGFWRGVWIIATQDADRNFRQIIVRFPIKAFNSTQATDVKVP